jgi:hypothetical protein
MKALNRGILGAAVAAAFSIGSAAHAGVVIDLFVDPVGGEQSVATSTLGGIVTNQNGVAFPTTSVVGGYRDLSIHKTFDNVGGVNSGESKLTAGDGVLQLDNATGNKSVGVVTWDGINNAGNNGLSALPTGFGGVGIDLTVGGVANQFLASIIAADLGFDYKIRVWDMDGDLSVLSAGVQFAVNPLDNAHAGFLFNWFNLTTGTYCDGIASPPACANPATQLDFSITRAGGLIDFTRIGALQLELSNVSTASVDLALGAVSTVPEPNVLSLLGVALFGAAFASRRRKVK